MNIVDQVYEFNTQCLGLTNRERGLLSQAELNYADKAIKEELQEFVDAHAEQDYIGAIDGAIDLVYFGIGFLVRMGLKAEEIKQMMSAVHDANMAKKAGTQDKRGGEGVVDAVKPEGWVPPEERIIAILEVNR